MRIPAYCEHLLQRFGAERRLRPFVAPLGPFLDPGSRAFEQPEFGYHLFCRTLADHQRAFLGETWQHILSYETDTMDRDSIARATYDVAERLNELKRRYELIDDRTFKGVAARIAVARTLLEHPDTACRHDLDLANHGTMFGDDELKWPVRHGFHVGWMLMRHLAAGLGAEIVHTAARLAGRYDTARIGNVVGLLLAVWLFGGAATAGPIVTPLTRPDMARAVAMARWPTTDAGRAAFHSRYTFEVPDSGVSPFRVDRIEVTTEFRRLELIAEAHARLNDLWGRPGTRDAENAMRPWRDSVTIAADVSYRDITRISPASEIDVTIGGSPRRRGETARSLIYSNCGPEPIYCTIVGARIESTVDATTLAGAAEPVAVTWNNTPVAMVTIPFRELE
jgi:hypothetical protein